MTLVLDGTKGVSASGGLYAANTFTGTYTDGIVVDYINGNGRISVGAADGLTIYNGGVANTSLVSISNTGSVGIGTVPSYKLDVNGNSRFNTPMVWSGTTDVANANITGNYTSATWYSVFSTGTGAPSVTTSGTGAGPVTSPGFYIAYVYAATFTAGGDSYYPYLASVPFYWSGTNYGSNDTTTQTLPTLYGIGLAKNTQTFTLRLRNTYAADGNIYLDWQSNQSMTGLDGSSYGKILQIGLRRIA